MLNNSIFLKMKDLELENSPDLSEDDDEDICDDTELKQLFKNVEPSASLLISPDKYILHLSASSVSNPYIAAALTDHTCQVFQLNESITEVNFSAQHDEAIIDCILHNNHNLYTGSKDGTIKLWDLRTKDKAAICFQDASTEPEEARKTLTCFDISSNERLLTAGTETLENDAFILFWDIRNNKLLGGYWESHTDDITQVKFHPNNNNLLMSSSTDGLINIYDLEQSEEENALIDTLNTENSIDRINWFSVNNKDHISCITDTFDLQLWQRDDAEPYKTLTRSETAQHLKRKNEDYVYLVSANSSRNELLLLAGSNANNGSCFRSLNVKRKGEISTGLNFEGNKQIVRSSWFNENLKLLITGGEKGVIDVWKTS